MNTAAPIKSIYVLMLAALAFGSSVFFGFNLDDNIVLEHPSLTSGSLFDAFSQPYYRDPSGAHEYGYRPISTLSFYLQKSIFGLHPSAGHALNLGLYLLLLWRLFSWCKAWLPEMSPLQQSWLIALFAMHPLHVETVVSIKNREEILALWLAIEAGLALARWAKEASISQGFWTWAAIALSLGSKLSAYPLLLLLVGLSPMRFALTLSQCLFLSCSLFLPSFWLSNSVGQGLAMGLAPFVFALLSFSFTRFKEPWLTFIKGNGKTLKEGGLWILMGSIAIVASWVQQDGLWATVGLALLCVSELGQSGLCALAASALAWRFGETGLHNLAFGLYTWRFFTTKSRPSMGSWLLGAIILISLVVQTQNLQNAFWAIPLIFMWFMDRKWPQHSPWLFLLVGTMAYAWGAPISFSGIWLGLSLWKTNQKAEWLKLDWKHHLLSYLLIFSWLLSSNPLPVPPHYTQRQLSSTLNTTEKSSLSEGRTLEYIENPLQAESPLLERWALASETMGHYSWQMLWPLNLRSYYGLGYFQSSHWRQASPWVSLLFHLGLIGAMIHFRNRHPFLSFGLLIYLSSLFLFSNALVWVAGVAGDRLAFTASLGACMALASLLPANKNKVLYAMLAFWGLLSILRVQQWKDPLTLLRHDSNLEPSSGQSHYLLAMALMQEAQTQDPPESQSLKQEAQSHFLQSLEVDSQYFNARVDLARSYAETGQFQLSEEQLLRADRIQPNNEVVWRELSLVYFDSKRAESCLNAIEKYRTLHKTEDEAIQEIQAFLVYSFRDRDQGMALAKVALESFPSNPQLKQIALGTLTPAQAQ